MTDRRSGTNTPEEKISRVRDRRMGDRRDSPRLPMTFLIRDQGEDSPWEEREGDISIGGIHWLGKTSPNSQKVEVRFRLPGVPKEIRAQGEIIRLSEGGKGIGFHVRFTELDVESELAVARYIDDQLVNPAQTNPLVP
ncbi:MAG: PilZ domain-containing protein [Myxococcaceae bacterium]